MLGASPSSPIIRGSTSVLPNIMGRASSPFHMYSDFNVMEWNGLALAHYIRCIAKLTHQNRLAWYLIQQKWEGWALTIPYHK